MNISAEWLAHIVTIIGFPFAIGTYIYEKRKEWRAEEEKLFDELDESYVAFMNLALSNSDLDIFKKPCGEGYTPTADQLNREEAIFGILISLFERCFLMFRHKSEKLRKDQWEGWVRFMQVYLSRPGFIRIWNQIGDQFDMNFQRFLNELIEESQ